VERSSHSFHDCAAGNARLAYDISEGDRLQLAGMSRLLLRFAGTRFIVESGRYLVANLCLCILGIWACGRWQDIPLL